LPNVGPYICDVSISGFTRSSIYIYDISSLRVKQKPKFRLSFFKPLQYEHSFSAISGYLCNANDIFFLLRCYAA